MTDANTICHDVDLLGDWLDAKGYTEEAGLCLRVLGLIHERDEEIEKTKRFYIEAGFELRQLREDNKRLHVALADEQATCLRVGIERAQALLKVDELRAALTGVLKAFENVTMDENSKHLFALRAAAAALKGNNES